MAQLVLGAAGAAVGFYFGGPTGAQYGFAAGAALGGYYETVNKKIEGPRLSDLRVTGTEYGECIPYVIGAPRISGQVWWASEKRAVGNTTGGKGGEPQVTTYTYEVDLLIGLTANEIESIGRIWLNGKLVYIGNERQDLWRRMTVYTGASDQMPDPTYEAAVGSANACAYRGRGSVFFEGLQIDGYGQLPNLTFELNSAATGDEHYDDVLLLMLNNGTAGAPGVGNPVIDSGPLGLPVVHSNVQFSTSTKRYGSASLELLGDNTIIGTQVDATADSRFALSGSLQTATIEFWANVSAHGPIVCRRNTSNAAAGWAIYTNRIRGNSGSGFEDTWLTWTGPSLDAWHHYRIVIDGGLLTVYVNSSQVASRTYEGFIESDDYLTFGVAMWGASAEDPIDGFLDDFRWTYGVARDGSDSGSELPDHGFVIAWQTTTLRAAVETLCERAGMAAGDFDASALASITQPVRGIAIAQVEPMRGTLDQLRQAYLFDAALSDKLYFRPRGASSVRTLTYEEIGAGFDGAAGDPLVVSVANDLELPPQIAVQYRNAANDYQVGTEYSDRLISGQVAAVSVQFGLGLLPTEAKKAADVIVTDAHAGIVSAQFATGIEHADLEPADVLQVTDRAGKLLRVRIVRKRDEGGVLTFETARDYASVIESEEITDDGYTEQGTVTVLSETELMPLDIPITRDEDNGPGYYVAARGATSSKWAGAEVRSSVNNVDFSTVATIRESAVLGTCTTTLGDSADGAALLDMVNSVTVSVLYGELASSTRAAMFADETINVMVIGDEVVRFITATQSSSDPNVYVLSGLFRGVLGTEWAIGSHGADEQCCLLRPQGLRRVSTQTSDIGVARYLKGVSLGLATSTALSESFTDTGRGLKPWAPVNLRQSKSGSDYTITWDRRTRLKTRFASSAGISVPLGEASEAYEVELLDGSDVLVDTFNATTGSVTFSGSYTGYKVRVYQISETVGRGYASATLTLI